MSQTNLRSLLLPGVLTFNTRADYKKLMGVDPPAFDPALPVQCWVDTVRERVVDVPTVVNPSANPYRGFVYNLVVRETVAKPGEPIVYGVAVLEPTYIPACIATRLNLPGEQYGIRVDNMQIPIRDLLPGEVIESNPFGITVVGT